MLTDEQAQAVCRRYPQTVSYLGNGELEDLENGTVYCPASLRDAIGWINAGESDSDGSNARSTRIARHWHNHTRD